MASLNRVTLIGNLGQDPELKYLPDGTAVCTISLATNEKWKGKDGTPHEKTEWHRIVLWARTAEVAGEYLKKGSAAYIEGRLETRKWQDKAGVDRYTTEIRADRLQFLGDGGGARARRPEPPEPTAADGPPPRNYNADVDADIPF